MEDISNPKSLIKTGIYIGEGRNARCYKTTNNEVIKIFKNNGRTSELFRLKDDIKDHLERLKSLNYDTYLSPREIYTHNGKVIGYKTLYGGPRTLARIKNTLIKDLIEYLKYLEEDTYKVSLEHFRINDLHDKNIIVNDKIYIIDLDHGIFYDTKNVEQLFKENIFEIRYILMNSLFGVHNTTKSQISFSYSDIEETFHDFLKNKISIEEFIDTISELYKYNINNINDLKKCCKRTLRLQRVDDYYRHL